ncbi:MAG: choice-of-anchor tandem repeat GloVer-containing protein [Candidatus Cybelea sp.]
MRILGLGRHALTSCAAAAILAGCGGSPMRAIPGFSSAGFAEQRTRPNIPYAILYSFKGGSVDGASPSAPLLEVNGVLYGTTAAGGGTGCVNGCGTVFAVTTSGVETALHYFDGGSDGANPVAGLINVKGILYGTTERGGDMSCAGSRGPGCGTIFSISTRGKKFRVLHVFSGGSDGRNSAAGLLDVKGRLYGTTQFGGGDGCFGGGCGTVYSIGRRGEEHVLYSFLGSQGDDGSLPMASLIDVNRMLYGTTYDGVGNGVVYRISTDGAEQVLHRFKKYPKGGGRFPFAGLVNVNGTLYGTTKRGGRDDDGTVYSISKSGEEKVLFSFHGYDGLHPSATLIDLNGTLYGTTQRGGSGGCKNGCGTVYSITTQGEENVLYNFGSTSNDGLYPSAALIDVNSTLYGTTSGGGTNGDGTVFTLTP